MKFSIGDIVRLTSQDLHPKPPVGLVLRVDDDYHGARQAFKVYGAQRGQAIGPRSVNGIGPTKDGIRDRVLVWWPALGAYRYEESTQLTSV